MAIITIKEIDKDSVTVRVDFMDRDFILGVGHTLTLNPTAEEIMESIYKSNLKLVPKKTDMETSGEEYARSGEYLNWPTVKLTIR